MTTSQHTEDQHIAPFAWIWWGAVGAVTAMGVVSIFSIGLALLPVGLVMAVLGLALSSLRNRAASMVLVGAGAVPLLVAWLNRTGPGTVCTTEGSTAECTEVLNPWPFAVVALLLVAAGLGLSRLLRASGRAQPTR